MIPAWAKGTLVLLLTLAAGVAIGVSYERRREPPHETTHADADHLVRHLERALDLDPKQRDTVAVILARRQGVIDSAWRAMQPRVHATLDDASREIMVVLRPEQAARFRRLVGAHHSGASHP